MSNNNNNSGAPHRRLRVGITQGDTNGVGYEVILKSFAAPELTELCTPVIYGSSKVMTYHRKAIALQAFQANILKNNSQPKEGVVNLIEVIDEVKVELGTPDKAAGRAAFVALEAAVSDLKSGNIDVLVTAPINKDTIQSDEFRFAGHTEYLEASLGDRDNDRDNALMILCNDKLRVALVTTHLPLAAVPAAITVENVVEKLNVFNRSLREDFNIVMPRIAVLALNPHAGDNGLLGTEEKTVITPAIKQAGDNGILCFGPYPADGFFGNEQYRHFDGVLAMYHDQGLAPFKAIAVDDGVNFTAGLPYVRTSPDHGTGYDIAGQGIANENSLRQAIYTAIDIYRNRVRFEEMYRNPLKKLYVDRGKDNVVLDLTKDE